MRIILFGAQIAFSVLVFASAQNSKKKYTFFIAFLVHSAIDAFSLAVSKNYIAVSTANVNLIYVTVSIALILTAFFIYKTLHRQNELATCSRK